MRKKLSTRSIAIIGMWLSISPFFLARSVYGASEIPETKHQMVLIRDSKVEPRTVTLAKDSAVLFVVNRSADALATVRFDFGNRPTHCASQGLVKDPNGTVRTESPLGYRDFVSVCFPETGQYTLHIDGVAGAAGSVPVSVTVQ